MQCIFHKLYFTYQFVFWCSVPRCPVRAVCCVQSVPLPEPRSSAPSPSVLSSAELASAALPSFRSECLPARLPLSPSTPFPSEFQTMSEQEKLALIWKLGQFEDRSLESSEYLPFQYLPSKLLLLRSWHIRNRFLSPDGKVKREFRCEKHRHLQKSIISIKAFVFSVNSRGASCVSASSTHPLPLSAAETAGRNCSFGCWNKQVKTRKSKIQRNFRTKTASRAVSIGNEMARIHFAKWSLPETLPFFLFRPNFRWIF